MKKYLRMNKSRCCFIRIYWWEEEFVCLSVTWYGNVDIMASHLIYFVSCPAPPPGGDQTAGPHQPAMSSPLIGLWDNTNWALRGILPNNIRFFTVFFSISWCDSVVRLQSASSYITWWCIQHSSILGVLF